ncbi:MAG: DUF420 domain-containing protein [Planctomycetota bacterium]|nr:MAG: DUF420 domain-containing protein [Planctomycetota bacterium]
MDLSALPGLNATLNATAAVLLVAGFVAVKRGRIAVHKGCMLGAVAASALFLTSYLYYHAHAGTTRFAHGGAIRAIYLAILGSHTLLAAALAVLVPITLWRAWRDDRERHRRIARWTWPIWLYVSVTGVVIYLMLYVWFPAPPAR